MYPKSTPVYFVRPCRPVVLPALEVGEQEPGFAPFNSPAALISSSMAGVKFVHASSWIPFIQ